MKTRHIAASLIVLLLSCVFTTTLRAADETSRDFLPLLVGKWSVIGTAAGTDIEGTFVFRWADEKACLTSTFDAELGGQSIKGNHVIG